MAAQNEHTVAPPELALPKTLHDDRHRFETVDVPVVTTSASFRSDIAQNLGERTRRLTSDIVFSRAHYSMAVGIMRAALERKLTTWLIDPVNYVTGEDWNKIVFLAKTGQFVARFPVLKTVKDLLDTVGRGRLPLTQAITSPLLFATAKVGNPVVSLHYETGNILAKEGKKVIQVVTDPHIRPQYLYEAERPNIVFAVFDENTKEMFLESVKGQGKQVNPERIIVTGPPVDPRIVKAREKKTPPKAEQALRLAITTGGLGQNKGEIESLVRQLGPQIKAGTVQVVLYASTLPDFFKMYEDIAHGIGVEVGRIIDDETAALRIFYSTSIVDSNQFLVDYVFPWADGFVTKPSGDMAYDAVAAGCFLLLLEPWGEWEENIGKIFTNLGIAQKADVTHFADQIDELLKPGWVKNAIKKAENIDPLFLNGAKTIVDLQQKLKLEWVSLNVTQQ